MVGSTYATFARFLLILHLSAYKHSMNEEIKDSPYPKQLPIFCSFLLHYKCCTLLKVLKFLNWFSLSDFKWWFEAVSPKKSEKIVTSFHVREIFPILLFILMNHSIVLHSLATAFHSWSNCNYRYLNWH